jgi:NAD(P)-dependent dehydrogenase (short-subunit alcohol dehydrogenase family)
MSGALAGRTAVVTGGGRGIGRATAVALVRAGVTRVALIARSAAQLDEAADEVRSAGGEPVILAADLSDIDGVAGLVQRLGDVDILINNAATVAPLGPTVDLAPNDVLAAFRLNSVAPVVLAGRLAPGMIERGWGRVVNVSSGAAANAATAIGSGVYAATKIALEAHTLAFASELAGTGVTVNAYRPGVVDTAMQEWVREQDPDAIGRELHGRFVASHEAGRLITPARSGEALVAHLASEESGQIWDVNDAL